ncbi:hypothetical protein INT47_005660 [Mucor saturninus]|uniref:Uncharacterized protein n=1 Tax=Mucor saturninus TaxID=64648 RepID=A0A8H7UX81_9FUNG|nr:hypothetical protein INT47_005660 [Mucor saturninus]
MSTTKCLLYPITYIPLLDKEDGMIGENKVLLPPTPITSDDEEEGVDTVKSIKLARRGTVSLVDLIPVASAALRAKHRLSSSQTNNPPSTQDSPLARALTKVKIGVQTHRLKERYLTNEWIRLALAAPLDESTINTDNMGRISVSRTREIVKWYEYKFKRSSLSLQTLEENVDALRRQKLLWSTLNLPSPPATRLSF